MEEPELVMKFLTVLGAPLNFEADPQLLWCLCMLQQTKWLAYYGAQNEYHLAHQNRTIAIASDFRVD